MSKKGVKGSIILVKPYIPDEGSDSKSFASEENKRSSSEKDELGKLVNSPYVCCLFPISCQLSIVTLPSRSIIIVVSSREDVDDEVGGWRDVDDELDGWRDDLDKSF